MQEINLHFREQLEQHLINHQKISVLNKFYVDLMLKNYQLNDIFHLYF